MSARYPNGHDRGPDTKPRKRRWDVGPLSAGWKGGRCVKDGYIVNPVRHTLIREHRTIVERIIGRSLPPDSVVHHVNGVRSDNRPCNLVVLQDRREHQELHRKMRVRAAGGDPWGPRQPRVKKSYYVSTETTRAAARERMRRLRQEKRRPQERTA